MKKLSILAILASVAIPAFAEDDVKIETIAAPSNPEIGFPHGMQIGLGVSATSGLNGFVGYANKNFDSFWWKRFGVRLDFATTSPLKSTINSAIDNALSDGVKIGDGMRIDGGDLSAHHVAAMLDFYPFGNTWFLGGLRISGGYYTGKMNLVGDLSSKLDVCPVAFDLDGETYRYSDGTRGRANGNWNYAGPYLGTGFDLGLFWGIKIYMDAGVVFTSKTAALNLNGAPLNAELQHWNGAGWDNVQGNAGLEAGFNDAKDAAFTDAKDTMSDIKFYPMIKLGLMYRF